MDILKDPKTNNNPSIETPSDPRTLLLTAGIVATTITPSAIVIYCTTMAIMTYRSNRRLMRELNLPEVFSIESILVKHPSKRNPWERLVLHRLTQAQK